MQELNQCSGGVAPLVVGCAGGAASTLIQGYWGNMLASGSSNFSTRNALLAAGFGCAGGASAAAAALTTGVASGVYFGLTFLFGSAASGAVSFPNPERTGTVERSDPILVPQSEQGHGGAEYDDGTNAGWLDYSVADNWWSNGNVT